MKTKNKALLLTLCAVLLVAASVMGTIAYLTSHDAVVNTFSVGSISMSLDEAPVNADGKETTGDRVEANSYKLLPGHEYDKDPTIHMVATSEDAWVFVKIENGIESYESTADGYTNIETQITDTYGWTELTGVEGVYYKEWHPNNALDLQVFDNFKIADNANEIAGWADIKPESTKINVTGYAVQMDRFENNPAGAWDVVKDAANQN